MFVDTSKTTQNGKVYTRHLIRDSQRVNGKVTHRTIANISDCAPEEIRAIKLALKHKGDLGQLGSLKNNWRVEQGLSVGAVWALRETAKELGIIEALGPTRQGKLVLWQVIARIIDQGSRLSAVRLAGSHAALDVLSLDKFNEDDLYENLDWLAENQSKIEDRLLRSGYPTSSPDLFLYDVTSSYFEGVENQLARFGYNRDGKKGKKQIVIGLLCDRTGDPLSIEVFEGNTQDPKTFASQVKKVSLRFGGGDVTFVGDRGMIKSKEIEDLLDESFHYITAITKPQIQALLNQGMFQMSVFDQSIAEIEAEGDIRYILRRNPVRAEEIRNSRADKLDVIAKLIERKNVYLKEHPKAKGITAVNEVTKKLSALKISWASVELRDRTIVLLQDDLALSEISKLDGCYVLKTDLAKDVVDKETVHARYKDLALVESAFRDCKTVHLETRPVYVRLATRTRGHVFAVMLAYKIIRRLAQKWAQLNVTVEEAIGELAQVCTTKVCINESVFYNSIPLPRPSVAHLLKLANIVLPTALPATNQVVSTKKKLPTNRRRH